MMINSNMSMFPLAINEQKANTDSALEKIAATRELSGQDNADLLVANQLFSQTTSTVQEIQNANESVSMLQIADGALSTLSDNTARMEELSVNFNNGALNASQQNALSEEFGALQTANSEIMQGTTYNGQALFGGNSPVGLEGVDTSAITIGDQEGIQAMSSRIDSQRSNVGSSMLEEQVGINNRLASLSNTTASYAQIAETPLDQSVSNLQNSNTQLTASVLAQAHQTDTLRQQMAMLVDF